MGDYKPLLIGLSILFVIGFVIPLFMNPFVSEGSFNQDSIATGFLDKVENGVTFLTFDIDLFGFLGDGVRNFVISQIEAFSFIPNIIATPLLALAFILIIYGLLSLLPGV